MTEMPNGQGVPQSQFRYPPTPVPPPSTAPKPPASTAAWAYEIGMGVVQVAFGLMLVLGGSQLSDLFSSPFTSNSQEGGFLVVLMLLIGIGFIVAGAARPFRLK